MKKPELVILIVAILLVIAILAVILILWLRGTQSQSPPSSPSDSPGGTSGNAVMPVMPLRPANIPINYGNTIYLLNRFNMVALSSCGANPSCSGNNNATLRTDGEDVNSRRWKIFLESNRDSKAPVLYGDKVILENVWNKSQKPNPNALLAVCGNTGSGCGDNVVVGRNNSQPGSSVWTIIGKENGNIVSEGDTIQLISEYNDQIMSACGTFEAGNNCGYNVSLRTDSANPSTRYWTIMKVM